MGNCRAQLTVVFLKTLPVLLLWQNLICKHMHKKGGWFKEFILIHWTPQAKSSIFNQEINESKLFTDNQLVISLQVNYCSKYSTVMRTILSIFLYFLHSFSSLFLLPLFQEYLYKVKVELLRNRKQFLLCVSVKLQ